MDPGSSDCQKGWAGTRPAGVGSDGCDGLLAVGPRLADGPGAVDGWTRVALAAAGATASSVPETIASGLGMPPDATARACAPGSCGAPLAASNA